MIKRFQDIEGVDPQALELLEAAGYVDTGSIQGKGIVEITEELIKANNILSIIDEEPTASKVQEWLAPIEDAIGSLGVKQQRVKSEYIIEPSELLATTYATPISQAFIDKFEVDLASLPVGKAKFTSEEAAAEHEFTMLDESLIGGIEPVPFSPSDMEADDELDDLGELDPLPELEQTMIQKVKFTKNELEQTVAQTVKAETLNKNELEKTIRQTVSAPKNTEDSTDPAEVAIKHSEDRLAEVNEIFSGATFTASNASLQKERILSMEDFRQKGSHVSPLTNAAASDLTKSVKKETNAGVDPSSRRYVRGVLHTHRVAFKVGSLAFILSNICILAGIILTPLVLVDKEQYSWAVWSPLLIVLGLFIYLTLARKASCPICNQKQYRPKACLKHRNAHHFPIIGYMLPTALHALLFKWFRCIFCGTSVRLKRITRKALPIRR